MSLTEQQRQVAESLLADAREVGLADVVEQLETLLTPQRFKTTLQAPGKMVSYRKVDSMSDPKKSYVVTSVGMRPVACTCPAWNFNRDTMACKHMGEF